MAGPIAGGVIGGLAVIAAVVVVVALLNPKVRTKLTPFRDTERNDATLQRTQAQKPAQTEEKPSSSKWRSSHVPNTLQNVGST